MKLHGMVYSFNCDDVFFLKVVGAVNYETVERVTEIIREYYLERNEFIIVYDLNEFGLLTMDVVNLIKESEIEEQEKGKVCTIILTKEKNFITDISFDILSISLDNNTAHPNYFIVETLSDVTDLIDSYGFKTKGFIEEYKQFIKTLEQNEDVSKYDLLINERYHI